VTLLQHKWIKIAVTINIRYRQSGLRISYVHRGDLMCS